jgi:hypothetical protein
MNSETGSILAGLFAQGTGLRAQSTEHRAQGLLFLPSALRPALCAKNYKSPLTHPHIYLPIFPVTSILKKSMWYHILP